MKSTQGYISLMVQNVNYFAMRELHRMALYAWKLCMPQRPNGRITD